jgi:hypothetical protein
LPFENLSHDPDNAYFADGIQEEILTRLSKIADLKVISRTSTQRYKSSPTNLREIVDQLGVAHVLEGDAEALPVVPNLELITLWRTSSGPPRSIVVDRHFCGRKRDCSEDRRLAQAHWRGAARDRFSPHGK